MEEKERIDLKEERKIVKADWNMKPYLAIALLTFIVFCCCIAVFFMIYRYNGFATGWNKLMKVMQPIIIGFVVAYLLNPVMMFIEKYLNILFGKKVKGKILIEDEKKKKKTSRAVATFGALLVMVLVFYLLLMMIIPQLIQSISGVATSLPTEVKALSGWIEGKFSEDSKMADTVSEALNNGTSYLENWLQTSLLPKASTYIASITSGVISVVKVLFNIIIGLIISVYVLLEKEKFIGQSKKVIYAVFKPQKGNIIVATIRKSNLIFGGFISGKILDSVIIGVICYVVLAIMKMPYTVLVSVIVGVTNVIPFFGPYIGAIPSIIIIALANPIQGLYFLIFIIILQQVDGNIIGPKILGDSTGLSSFWVVFAILIGGGIFGVGGMILGVPAFAVIYYIVQQILEHMLKKKELPPETEPYKMLKNINVDTNELEYFDNGDQPHRVRLKNKENK